MLRLWLDNIKMFPQSLEVRLHDPPNASLMRAALAAEATKQNLRSRVAANIGKRRIIRFTRDTGPSQLSPRVVVVVPEGWVLIRVAGITIIPMCCTFGWERSAKVFSHITASIRGEAGHSGHRTGMGTGQPQDNHRTHLGQA